MTAVKLSRRAISHLRFKALEALYGPLKDWPDEAAGGSVASRS